MTLASGCGSFGAAEEPSSEGGEGGDGIVASEQPRLRRVVVAPNWPTVAELDPATDLRGAKILVTVTDATDATRTVQKSFGPTEKGPYAFADFNTTNLVDVTIELDESSGRILGYGERRRWNLATSDTVLVATRKRLLYFTSDDRDGGQLRVFDLAPAAAVEPGMAERAGSSLPSLKAPSALYVTTDGLLLVQAGRMGSGTGPAQVTVFETGTHLLSTTIALPYPLAGAVPLRDGHRLLGAPTRDAMKTSFALVDIDTAAVVDLPSGLQGGAVSVSAMATSPDGARFVAVGSYSNGQIDIPYVFTHDVGSPKVTATDLSSLLDVARGARFMPDGKTFVVAGAKNEGEWATGALLFFGVTSGALAPPTRRIDLAPGLSRSSSLIIDPAGTYAYVGNETRYTNPGSCCGDLRVIDLASRTEAALLPYGTSGPEFELTDAVRMPYGAHRVIAGQSDNGNNVHGAVLELLPNSPRPVAIPYTAAGDIGSMSAIATPFGTKL